jgi:hypothetical protein
MAARLDRSGPIGNMTPSRQDFAQDARMRRCLSRFATIGDRRARYTVLASAPRLINRGPECGRVVTNGEVRIRTMRTFFHCVENDLSWLAQAFRVLTGTTSTQTQIERRPAR